MVYSEKFVHMFFVHFRYPADFTFVCPTEILAFSDRIEEFKAIGAEVLSYDWKCCLFDIGDCCEHRFRMESFAVGEHPERKRRHSGNQDTSLS
jgi:hypothetical protein